jgi:hypothetical protein
MTRARARALDPLPGAEALVWLVWQGKGDDRPRKDSEIRLWWSRKGDAHARSSKASAAVTPLSNEDGRKLERIRIGTDHYIAIVVDSRDRTRDRRDRAELAVSFSRYDAGGSLPPQEIAVDDRTSTLIARWEGSAAYATQTNRTIAWLAERFLLDPEPGAAADSSGRMIVSAVLGENGNPTGYHIHGRGFVADVRTVDNRLLLDKVRRTTERDRKRLLRLIHAQVRFQDVSRVGALRADMHRWIDKLAAGEGFLVIWQEYTRLEARYLRRLVRETGKCRYKSWQRLADGPFRFTVDGAAHSVADEPSLLEQAQRAVDRGEHLELDASEKLPDALTHRAGDEAPDDWTVIEERLAKHVFSGRVTVVDVADGTLDVTPTELKNRGPIGVGGDRAVELKQAGFLYRSYRGDRRQIARRKAAFERILAGGTNIPNLLALLEGNSVDVDPPVRIEPRSEAAWAIFDGRPTRRQQDALDVALNTPDIAVIQGPPGTGKTEVIAAIQTRLAEAGKSYARLRGSILLASFQHAAVDEMAKRSEVFGLPADKVDRADRGSTVLRDRLRDNAVAKLSALIGAPGEAVLALRQLSGLVATYWLAPPAADHTVSLLTDVLNGVRAHISAATADRLRKTRDELAITLATAPTGVARTEAHELALMAARGLRTTLETFADDGPQTAAKTLRRLRSLADSDESAVQSIAQRDLELLARAAEGSATDPPDFLTELAVVRDRLIDLLLPQTGPSPVPAADPAVADLLNEAVGEMEETLRRSPDLGPTLALVDYLQALDSDPQAVEWTLRAYTASYATTCQQAASNKLAEAKHVGSGEDVVFDTVIIDEAARANPLDLMIPMTLAARRIVLVGDHHQLPPMLEPDVERQLIEQDTATQDTLRRSLFQRLFEAHAKPGAPVKRVVTLDAQFRMHEVLGDFVSRNFYYGQLKSPLGAAAKFAHGLPGYGDTVAAWIDVPNDRGREYRTRSTHRPAEVMRLVPELGALITAIPDLTFGVVAFYTDQIEQIGRRLEELGIAKRTDRGHYEGSEDFRQDSEGRPLDRLHVGSVDSFQGKQFDVVLLSTTRSAPPGDERPPPGDQAYQRWVRRRYGHLLLVNRLCVAMSRQRRLLITIGDAAMFEAPRAPAAAAPIGDFLQLCRRGGAHGRFLPA